MTVNQNSGTVGSAAKALAGILSESPLDQPKPQQVKEGEAPAEAKTGKQETPQGDTESNPRRVKAKLGDREIEFEVLTDDVDLDLIPKGLMMESDYRKKTSEVSESRKILESEKQKLTEQLSELETMLYGEAKELDSSEMLELKEVDPTEYLRQRDKFESKVKKLKAYKEQTNAEMQKRHAELLQQEISKYTEVIPEWMDESKKAQDTSKMAKTLKEAGFSDEEMGSIYDHRLMALFRKAALYDEIKNTPVESKRKAPKTQSAGPGEKQEVTERETALARLKKTGKQRDAQAAIKNLLGV